MTPKGKNKILYNSTFPLKMKRDGPSLEDQNKVIEDLSVLWLQRRGCFFEIHHERHNEYMMKNKLKHLAQMLLEPFYEV